MKKLKIGVIGLGHAGQVYHLPGLSRFDDVELAICDIDDATLRQCGTQFGVPAGRCYRDARAMLEQFRPDAVEVLIPQYFLSSKHNPPEIGRIYLETVLDLLARKCPVLVEKPLAMNPDDAARLAAAAARAGVVNMVSVNRRFAPLVTHCLAEVRKLGPVLNCDCHFYKGWLPEKNTPGVYLDRLTSDLMHALDLMRFLGGEIRNFYPKQQRTAADEVPTAFFALADFAGGATGYFAANGRVGGRVQQWDLHGDGISCYIIDRFDPYDPRQKTGMRMEARIVRRGIPEVEKIRDEDLVEIKDLAGCCGFTAADRYFVDCVKNGVMPHCCFADQLETIRYCFEILASPLRTVAAAAAGAAPERSPES